MPPTVSSLDEFIATASQAWNPDEQMRKHTLPTGESVHCALWKGQFYITGTDIVRVVKARFYEAGIPIPFLRKFEEGIFSDLRNLKPGVDAVLELPRSEFLDFLFANGCIRTQKKQKVFLWSSVRHNMLFQDAIKREKDRAPAQPAMAPAAPQGFSPPAGHPLQKTVAAQYPPSPVVSPLLRSSPLVNRHSQSPKGFSSKPHHFAPYPHYSPGPEQHHVQPTTTFSYNTCHAPAAALAASVPLVPQSLVASPMLSIPGPPPHHTYPVYPAYPGSYLEHHEVHPGIAVVPVYPAAHTFVDTTYPLSAPVLPRHPVVMAPNIQFHIESFPKATKSSQQHIAMTAPLAHGVFAAAPNEPSACPLALAHEPSLESSLESSLDQLSQSSTSTCMDPHEMPSPMTDYFSYPDSAC